MKYTGCLSSEKCIDMADERKAGRWGEDQAAALLKRKKYKIIQRNYSCRFGEIDIIAENREYLVFAEVKLRRNADFAQAKEFVTAAKQRRIIFAAKLWLGQNFTEKQPRFDVIEIYAPEGIGGRISVNHIENAFEVSL